MVNLFYQRHGLTSLVDILGIRRVAARLFPKGVNFLQKQYHDQVFLDMLDRANSDPTFMERIITDNETLVYEFEIQTNQQSSK